MRPQDKLQLGGAWLDTWGEHNAQEGTIYRHVWSDAVTSDRDTGIRLVLEDRGQ